MASARVGLRIAVAAETVCFLGPAFLLPSRRSYKFPPLIREVGDFCDTIIARGLEQTGDELRIVRPLYDEQCVWNGHRSIEGRTRIRRAFSVGVFLRAVAPVLRGSR